MHYWYLAPGQYARSVRNFCTSKYVMTTFYCYLFLWWLSFEWLFCCGNTVVFDIYYIPIYNYYLYLFPDYTAQGNAVLLFWAMTVKTWILNLVLFVCFIAQLPLTLSYHFPCFSTSHTMFQTLQSYEPQLFKLPVQCLAAVAKALPPDHIDSSCMSHVDKKASMDTEGHFDPQPVDTLK